MNNKLQRRLIATHNQVDPSLVTAEDLVRAIQNATVLELANKLGFENDAPFNVQSLNGDTDSTWLDAVEQLANLITLPENKPRTPPVIPPAVITIRKGSPASIAHGVRHKDDLPFSEPINGVEQ